MVTLVEVLRPHRLDTLNQDSGKHCRCGSDSRFDGWQNMDEHRAAVVAEWLTSDEALEVVADELNDWELTDDGYSPGDQSAAALAALAAHAKGEVSWCLCGVVQALPDGTCGNCGRRIQGDDDE